MSPEEQFLWQCAREWRDLQYSPSFEHLDWSRVTTVARDNRMASLLDHALRRAGMHDLLPSPVAAMLADVVDITHKKAADYRRVLELYMPQAIAQNLETLVMKGLWLSERLYGDPTVRPGHDLDILIRRSRLQDCLAILERIGFGRYWPTQLADDFYVRHHLHLELSLADCWTWVEIHWAFDHPRTRLTVDYEAVIERARRSQLLGVPIWEPAPADLLISLCVHLVKHVVYLPHVLDHPERERLILASGHLLHFIDVAEAVRHYADDISWEQTVRLAQEYGANDALGAALRICHDLLNAPVPQFVLKELAPQAPGRAEGLIMNRLALHELATYADEDTSRFWRLLVAENYRFVFRPIRLLDFASYAWPGADYLERRYGRAGAATAVPHLLSVMGEYVRLARDVVYFNVRRRRSPPPLFVTLPAAEEH